MNVRIEQGTEEEGRGKKERRKEGRTITNLNKERGRETSCTLSAANSNTVFLVQSRYSETQI